jgi:hypothetical protein
MARLVRHPNAARPGPGFIRSLHDSEWTTAGGKRMAIPDMTTAHLWNVLGYLRWYAPQVAEQVPDRAGLSLIEVVTSTPIWASICTELMARGEISRRKDALPRLRAGGETEWERAARYARAAQARRLARISASRAAKAKSATP